MSWQTPENLSADGIRAVVTGTAGTGKAITDDGASGLAWATVGGAPTDASYVALGTNATLTNERVLTGTTNQIAITDNGAGGTVVLSTPQNIDTGASPQFAGINLGHASDTTLSRASAGVIAVEGVNVLLANVLTTDGDLLTRAAGVPARLGLGSALQILRTNAGATALEFAALSVTAVCCQCSINAYQNLTSATDNLVVFQQHDLITDATLHSTSSNKSRFVAPTGLGGKYKLTVNLTVENSSGAFCTYTLRWLKNGSIVRTLKDGQPNGGWEHLLSATYIFDLAAGDYAEFAINPNQSSNYVAFGADGTASVINSTACFERIGA